MRLKQRKSVVLPQPDAPISPVMQPARISTSISFSGCKSPYQRLIPRVRMLYLAAPVLTIAKPLPDVSSDIVGGERNAGLGEDPLGGVTFDHFGVVQERGLVGQPA